MKRCTKCNIEKSFDQFYKSNQSNDSYNWNCKVCCKKRTDEWLIKSDKAKDYILRKNLYKKRYETENKEIIKKRHKVYRDKEKEKRAKSFKAWYELNKSIVNKKKTQYRKACPLRNITFLLRRRMSKLLISGYVKSRDDLIKILGCDLEFCKKHIEDQFDERMSWDNHGAKTWHIDHIIPLASAKTEEELFILCHYTNLRPLWWIDNLKKGAKLDYHI